MINSRDPGKASLTPTDETHLTPESENSAPEDPLTEQGESEPKDAPNAGESPLG